MTPPTDQYAALYAIAELADYMPADDIPFYAALALNLHVDDLTADPQLAQLVQDLASAANPHPAVEAILAYTRPERVF